MGGPREGAVESVPDASFPSTLLVSFSRRRTDSRGTPSRGTAPCDDWRPPCSPPPRWRPSITRTPAAAAPRAPPVVPSFSAAAQPRAVPCGPPTGATHPWQPGTTDLYPRCSASRGPSCSRCGPASPTRPKWDAIIAPQPLPRHAILPSSTPGTVTARPGQAPRPHGAGRLRAERPGEKQAVG